MARQRPTRQDTPPSAMRWAMAGAAIGLLAGVTTFAPAAWLASAVTRITDGRVWLADASGTVWDGDAQLVFAGGDGSRDAVALPGRVAWRMRPSMAGFGAEVRIPCCAPAPMQLSAVPAWGGLSVSASQVQVQWPAALLAGLGTPWNTLQLDGSLRMDSERLSARWVQGRMVMEGSARFDAESVSSRLSTLRPMGSYRLILQGGNPTRLTLQTLEGGLQLSGSGEWVGDRLRFRGEASAQPEREAALANLLSIIGRRQGARSIISIG